MSFANQVEGQIATIANNGSVLFYNSPIAIEYDDCEFIAYQTNNGEILVNRYSCDWQLKKIYKVHNYSDRFRDTAGGNGMDDHAAPAIGIDATTGKLMLATAYHGTDLYIYQYDNSKDEFSLSKCIKGHYTYPNIVALKKETLIVLRYMYKKDSKWVGNLSVLSSLDGFSQRREVITPNVDEVVYASRPFLYGNDLFFTWGIHYYKKGYIDGWYVTQYNTKDNSTKTVDLSEHVKNYIENRPTAIAVKGNKIVAGTSCFTKRSYRKPEGNFNRENKIKIIEINLANNVITTIVERNVMAPYYGTDIFIDKDLDYVFFNRDQIISNKQIDCTRNTKKMYPYLYKRKLIYAVMKGRYRIRDFSNALEMCDFK